MLRDLQRQEGHRVNRSKVRRLMRLMGIEALYRKPKTTQRHPQHRVYPHLLRGLTIDRPNQVWAMDLTLYPDGQGLRLPRRFFGLVLSARVVVEGLNDMNTHFCLEAVKEAMEKFGKPDIFNTD